MDALLNQIRRSPDLAGIEDERDQGSPVAETLIVAECVQCPALTVEAVGGRLRVGDLDQRLICLRRWAGGDDCHVGEPVHDVVGLPAGRGVGRQARDSLEDGGHDRAHPVFLLDVDARVVAVTNPAEQAGARGKVPRGRGQTPAHHGHRAVRVAVRVRVPSQRAHPHDRAATLMSCHGSLRIPRSRTPRTPSSSRRSGERSRTRQRAHAPGR